MSPHLSVCAMILRCSAAVVICAGSLPTAALAAEEPSVPVQYLAKIGEPHPDFVLPRIDNGRPLRLSDYRGTKVLLIHFASW